MRMVKCMKNMHCVMINEWIALCEFVSSAGLVRSFALLSQFTFFCFIIFLPSVRLYLHAGKFGRSMQHTLAHTHDGLNSNNEHR